MNVEAMITDPIYVVTDVELDGLAVGENSMLSFASVAVTPDGRRLGEFEATLVPLPNAKADPQTTTFWQAHPEAYAAARLDPEDPRVVIQRFVSWVRNLPGDAIFAAHPLALDGPWIDFYLQRFANERIFEGPWRSQRLFRTAPLCLMSFAAGRLDWPLWQCDGPNYPTEWLGSHAHTHRAIDDARGYAHLLGHLMSNSQ
jgi:DNA polymerase III alpha subunit (gram-positive type)